ncbi:leucine rich adaptor protein 1-like isoform X1 [Nerophis lumbriciformis]|uniref:leucine rich adaptor protein 1-like isoform X1 n=1 Tax=Nerophis lumbriciformis TaxID=546530 RepID=UPI002ADF3F8B|nr:leucine rich adaptor protein 1-like isoform X1 [Nerophis lumbriciformis]
MVHLSAPCLLSEGGPKTVLPRHNKVALGRTLHCNVFPQLKDIETKLGRKVPESLIRCLAGGKHDNNATSASERAGYGKILASSTDFKRLESKMLLLKEEMANLRAIDVKLMHQLLSINEGIESIRWMIDDKGSVASQEGSLSSSLCSLSDSQDGASLGGSLGSLNDVNSDGLDTLSVGSYLDTLAEDFPEDPSPSNLDCLVDTPVIDGNTFSKSPLKLRVESDEYYCFG